MLILSAYVMFCNNTTEQRQRDAVQIGVAGADLFKRGEQIRCKEYRPVPVEIERLYRMPDRGTGRPALERRDRRIRIAAVAHFNGIGVPERGKERSIKRNAVSRCCL